MHPNASTAGETPAETPDPTATSPETSRSLPLGQLAAALAVVGLATAIGLAIRDWFTDADIVMVYLLGVVFVAYRMEWVPALSSALFSVAAFDFFFVTPYHTFTVRNLGYVLTFAVMAVVGLTISGLTARVKGEAAAARRREQHTAALYRLAGRLALETSADTLLQAAAEHVHEVFEMPVVLYRSHDGELEPAVRIGESPAFDEDRRAIRKAFADGEPAGASSATAPEARAFYVPVAGVNERVGLVGLVPSPPDAFADPERRELLEAHADQIGLFVERLRLAKEARETQLELETEKIRNAILSSVSHDLRTPLGSIMGAASTLADEDDSLSTDSRRRLADAIYEESRRLDRLLENLLKMTQIEGQTLEVDAQWHVPAEIIGAALSHLEPELADREITVRSPEVRRMAKLDGPLVEQLLVNLLENALQYSPEGTPIEVRVSRTDATVTLEVADRGEGVPDAEREIIFEKFRQGEAGAERGTGLGLTICRAIAEAHGGTIAVEDRHQGTGTVFRVELPQTEAPPLEPPPAGDDAGSSHPRPEP